LQSLKSTGRFFNCYDVELAVFSFSDLDSGVGPWIRIQAGRNGPQEKGEKLISCFVELSNKTRCISWSFDAFFGDLREII
jgi:hypothetical protein